MHLKYLKYKYLSYIRDAKTDHPKILGLVGFDAAESVLQPVSKTTILSHCESIQNVTST